MRILWIIPTFQHPSVRGSARHYHLLRELSARHEVTLATLLRVPVSEEAIEEVRALTRELVLFEAPLDDNRLRQYLGLRRGTARLRRFVRDVDPRDYDVVLFHGKPLFSAVEGLEGVPLAIDFCDATSARLRARLATVGGVERLLVGFRWLRMRGVERRVLRKTPHVAFISARDRDAVLGQDDASPVIPNGVDLRYWARTAPPADRPCLVFTGVMDYPPNDDAARLLVEEIVPLVRQRVPGLEVLIVGRNPSAALRERADGVPGVEVTGFVDDLRPYLERAAIFAAPLRVASGMQNKVLEALALEVPVVTTPAVAAGLRGADGREAPLVVPADTAEGFADAIVTLLAEPAEQLRLAAAGRRFVEEQFDWVRAAELLEQLCAAAAAGVEGEHSWRPIQA